MILKVCLSICLGILFSNNVSGHRIPRDTEETTTEPNVGNISESDQQLIDQTGCRYLSLGKDHIASFKKDGVQMRHTTMAVLSDEASDKPKFEMNFAVQTPSDFYIYLTTREQYEKSPQSKPDYDLALGTYNNLQSLFHFTAQKKLLQSLDLKNTTNILSADKYEKFYIILEDGIFKYGKHCQSEPIYTTDYLGSEHPEIVEVGFQSKSEHGAKVLFDCPRNFAGCPSEAA